MEVMIAPSRRTRVTATMPNATSHTTNSWSPNAARRAWSAATKRVPRLATCEKKPSAVKSP
ncbi:hypothetical protein [Sphingomonas sp. NIC1]|uniref:hypothetical protein n=1 Tax=Sphingomonas sp. NIC1 TaxID=1961362 RepID=UPI0007C0DB06|nr:hypothetical protein [Sphingomonas sp. NIC1]ANC86685.1 hypothetical protein A7E77_07125 [Sphingomonas sp. NIC1]